MVKKTSTLATPKRAKSATLGSLASELAALREQIVALQKRPESAAPQRKTKRPHSGGKQSKFETDTRKTFPTVTKSSPTVASLSAPVYELKEARPVGFASLRQASEKDTEDVFGGLLDFARIQWLSGRWDDLAQIDLQQIGSHPDRARLALFGAIGWLSRKDRSRARAYMQAALRYGCPASLISRVLLTGAHASLASTYQLTGRDSLALKHQDSLQQLTPSAVLGQFRQLTPPAAGDCRAGTSSNPDFSLSPRIRSAASAAVGSDNPTEEVARTLRSADLTRRERFLFLRETARLFLKAGNKMVASGFIEESSHLLDGLPESYRTSAVKDLLDMGLREEAFVLALRGIGTQTFFSHEENQKLKEARDALREQILNHKGHGHEVLLAFLSKHADRLREAKGDTPPTLIEIGTTRESAAGQGSTRRLMEFCLKHRFRFITVDMDSNNTQMAAEMFRESEVTFEAVHAKGEYFLESYEGDVDCIFLDAYDFDHGKHTELRQSRYEKFLGARISDVDCHKMHLDCASAIVKKLKPWTIVCLDDTWLEHGKWIAKGTLAMPYFLRQGLQLLDVRNRSALLGGNMWFQESTR